MRSTLMLVLVLFIGAACQPFLEADQATIARIKVTGDICAANWMQNITYDGPADTKPTKDQIKRFNAGRDAFCTAKVDKR